jgi:hypothetical protein
VKHAVLCARRLGGIWANSNGLAEIAVNQGRADRYLGLAIGTAIEIVS